MNHYTPRKLRFWRILALLLRGLAKVLPLWPVFVLIGLYLSPITPAVLTSWSYHTYGAARLYTDCRYLSLKGWVDITPRGECPPVTLLDMSGR